MIESPETITAEITPESIHHIFTNLKINIPHSEIIQNIETIKENITSIIQQELASNPTDAIKYMVLIE